VTRSLITSAMAALALGAGAAPAAARVAVSRAPSHYRLEPRGGSGTNPLVRAT
jgi:hypothetical protein